MVGCPAGEFIAHFAQALYLLDNRGEEGAFIEAGRESIGCHIGVPFFFGTVHSSLTMGGKATHSRGFESFGHIEAGLSA